MVRISINLLRWNSPWEEIRECIAAVLRSDYDSFEFTYMENLNESVPSLIEAVQSAFGRDPRLKLIRTGSNLGFSGGHNSFIACAESPLVMVLNPDAIIAPDFVKHIVGAFDDPSVGAATGKMIKPRVEGATETILDGTGIILFRSRRSRERGQLEVDRGQYDGGRRIFGVSGTAAVYRRSALEAVKLGNSEYFDADFFAYYEDLDLSWRLRLRGFECVYVPEAVVEHPRSVGHSVGGIKRFFTFVRHQRSFSLKVREWSWRNHAFCIIKNDFGWTFYRDLPLILARELAMLGFICVFMPSTLSAVPDFIRLLPRMLRKRKQVNQIRALSSKGLDALLVRSIAATE